MVRLISFIFAYLLLSCIEIISIKIAAALSHTYSGMITEKWGFWLSLELLIMMPIALPLSIIYSIIVDIKKGRKK